MFKLRIFMSLSPGALARVEIVYDKYIAELFEVAAALHVIVQNRSSLLLPLLIIYTSHLW